MGMTPSVTDLAEVELGQLHERLLGGDPVAPAELAERLVPLVWARLVGWAATVDDPHMVSSAVGLVIARSVRRLYVPETHAARPIRRRCSSEGRATWRVMTSKHCNDRQTSWHRSMIGDPRRSK